MGWNDFASKKIALISHNYNLKNCYGNNDFTEHFFEINKICDLHRCNTILYCLFTWDEKTPIQRDSISMFKNLEHVQCIILEVGNQKSLRKIMEIWLRDEPQPRQVEQCFAKSSQPYALKRDFIRDIKRRVWGNNILVICGESNICNFVPSNGTFNDPFNFNEILKSFKVNYVFNPLHDYMTRYEMKKKRCFYSSDNRAVVTVWNQGKRKGEAAIPWTLFFNEKDMTGSVQEITHNLRPDIKIGIVPELF